MKTLTIDSVFDAIAKERKYQDKKWGSEKPQSLPGFLLIIEAELAEAKAGWMKNEYTGRDSPLDEIKQIAAVCVACMEKYGTTGIALSNDDKATGAIE